MSDKNIIKNLMKMDRKYSNLSRNKYRGTARDKVNQGEFISFFRGDDGLGFFHCVEKS